MGPGRGNTQRIESQGCGEMQKHVVYRTVAQPHSEFELVPNHSVVQDPGLAHSIASGHGVFERLRRVIPSHLDRHL